MSFWDALFGTDTEKKREQYKALYNDLNSQLKSFKEKLKAMEGKVDSIVLIKVLRQLTLSDRSHICKRLKSQQLCQLHQFSKKV